VHAGSYPDGISERILFDTTAEILVAAAAHGTFNLHRIVHDEILQSDGELTPDNHKAPLRHAGLHKSLRIVNASAVTQKTSRKAGPVFRPLAYSTESRAI
jgi:hypothetical protein